MSSCKKEKDPQGNSPLEIDYRNEYTGNYHFVEVDYTRDMTTDSSGNFIWIENYDTTVFRGTIEKFGIQQLRVVFEPDAKEPKPYSTVSTRSPLEGGIMYPTVDVTTHKLYYPEIELNTRIFFSNGFADGKELYATFGGGSHSGTQSISLSGKKIQ